MAVIQGADDSAQCHGSMGTPASWRAVRQPQPNVFSPLQRLGETDTVSRAVYAGLGHSNMTANGPCIEDFPRCPQQHTSHTLAQTLHPPVGDVEEVVLVLVVCIHVRHQRGCGTTKHGEGRSCHVIAGAQAASSDAKGTPS